MRNAKLILFVLTVVAVLSSVVYVQSSKIERAYIPQPPDVLLFADDTKVKSIRASYCWTHSGKQRCVDKLQADQFPARVALVSSEVGEGTEFRFETRDSGDKDVSISYTVYEEGGRPILWGDYSGRFFLDLDPGLYVVEAEADWAGGNATYIYQIEYKEEGGNDLFQ